MGNQIKKSFRYYSPNQIPPEERGINIVLSLALLIYGTYGIVNNDFYIPARFTKGMSLTGVSAWIMYAAFLCAVLNLLSVVVDHYDERNNEFSYKRFARFTQVSGWALFFLAILSTIVIAIIG
ncbi:hypothetical protein TH61_09905 [Rufibacter sp. DG15C]|uniref:hypothetical protein n=1 Tax=Rufibacter sp. DG15C TaxID=1379909 RepID=UPI00078C6167|nr:hypothetical protein [Rufibacter sp. DG15C]AMM51426.1 hypothetical protein TH61_09905 [Rufibacter sp. DG15C]